MCVVSGLLVLLLMRLEVCFQGLQRRPATEEQSGLSSFPSGPFAKLSFMKRRCDNDTLLSCGNVVRFLSYMCKDLSFIVNI